MSKLTLIFIFLITQMNLVFASQKTIVCKLQGLTDPISFLVPQKVGDLPSLDFSYPVDVSVFSLREGNLLLVAMDHDDKSRLRIVISVQANKKSSVYRGQFMIDSGGNQRQIDNGPVLCK